MFAVRSEAVVWSQVLPAVREGYRACKCCKALGIAVCITVVLYTRMIEIYLYMSVAPIPFATLTNREWGTIGTNYVKGITALAFQGFFIMVCVGIYSMLVTDVTNSLDSLDLAVALWRVGAATVVLCFALFKTGSLSKSVFATH